MQKMWNCNDLQFLSKLLTSEVSYFTFSDMGGIAGEFAGGWLHKEIKKKVLKLSTKGNGQM